MCVLDFFLPLSLSFVGRNCVEPFVTKIEQKIERYGNKMSLTLFDKTTTTFPLSPSPFKPNIRWERERQITISIQFPLMTFLNSFQQSSSSILLLNSNSNNNNNSNSSDNHEMREETFRVLLLVHKNANMILIKNNHFLKVI